MAMALISDGLSMTLPMLLGVSTVLHFIVPGLAEAGLAGIPRQMIMINTRPNSSLRRLLWRVFINLRLPLRALRLFAILAKRRICIEATEESRSGGTLRSSFTLTLPSPFKGEGDYSGASHDVVSGGSLSGGTISMAATSTRGMPSV